MTIYEVLHEFGYACENISFFVFKLMMFYVLNRCCPLLFNLDE